MVVYYLDLAKSSPERGPFRSIEVAPPVHSVSPSDDSLSQEVNPANQQTELSHPEVPSKRGAPTSNTEFRVAPPTR
jgi:hypothetical protein